MRDIKQRFLQLLAEFAPTFINFNRMTNNEILYGAAIAHLGQDASPNDLAPDELGCAESFNDIYRKAFGKPLYEGNQLSTYFLYKALKESPTFKRTDIPKRGTTIISPTGFSKLGPKVAGHVGICGNNGTIMSNNSFADSGGIKGVWDENYTLSSWYRYFLIRKQLPVFYFDLV